MLTSCAAITRDTAQEGGRESRARTGRATYLLCGAWPNLPNPPPPRPWRGTGRPMRFALIISTTAQACRARGTTARPTQDQAACRGRLGWSSIFLPPGNTLASSCPGSHVGLHRLCPARGRIGARSSQAATKPGPRPSMTSLCFLLPVGGGMQRNLPSCFVSSVEPVIACDAVGESSTTPPGYGWPPNCDAAGSHCISVQRQTLGAWHRASRHYSPAMPHDRLPGRHSGAQPSHPFSSSLGRRPPSLGCSRLRAA